MYGNWCGQGCTGTGGSPIDNLDQACQEHDACLAGTDLCHECACHKALVDRANYVSRRGLDGCLLQARSCMQAAKSAVQCRCWQHHPWVATPPSLAEDSLGPVFGCPPPWLSTAMCLTAQLLGCHGLQRASPRDLLAAGLQIHSSEEKGCGCFNIFCWCAHAAIRPPFRTLCSRGCVDIPEQA